jgi:hypothetical protein
LNFFFYGLVFEPGLANVVAPGPWADSGGVRRALRWCRAWIDGHKADSHDAQHVHVYKTTMLFLKKKKKRGYAWIHRERKWLAAWQASKIDGLAASDC